MTKTPATINPDTFIKFAALAENEADGHFTIMKFTTNWRVMLGTVPDLGGEETIRHHIQSMFVGATVDEAMQKLMDEYEENPDAVIDFTQVKAGTLDEYFENMDNGVYRK
jgi:hypothetical protein